MSPIQWFWFCVGISIVALTGLTLSAIFRRFYTALAYGLIASLWIGLAATDWSEVYGDCAGKSGTVVSMLKALRLCPVQSTTVPLRMPQPDQKI